MRIALAASIALAVLCGTLALDAQDCEGQATGQRSPGNQRARALLVQVEREFKQGHYARSLVLCKQALGADPTYARAYIWLGAIAVKQGRIADAQAAYRKAVALAPGSADAKIAQARLAAMNGKNTSPQKVSPAATAAPQTFQRLVPQREVSVLDLDRAQGGWQDIVQNVSVNGKVFGRSGLMDATYESDGYHQGRVIVPNRGFDQLDVWVGKKEGSGPGTISFTVLGDGEPIFKSPPLDQNTPAAHVVVSIKGFSGVTLIPIPDEQSRNRESAVWAQPRFIQVGHLETYGKPTPSPISAETRLSLFEAQVVSGGWEDTEDMAAVRGRVFNKSILMNAYYDGEQTIGTKAVFSCKGYDRFEVWVGKLNFTGPGLNQFRVYGDGKLLYRSPPMTTADPAIKVVVPLNGCTGLTLEVATDKESRQHPSAVWAEPVLIRSRK